MSEESFLEKIMGDVSKTSATKQLVIGTSSGVLTGLICTRVGKVVAIAVGGGIIVLQIAKENGYIKVNWNKVNKKLDKISDKVEEKVTGEAPVWLDKMERYVDRKVENVEEGIRQQQKKVKKWFSPSSKKDDRIRMNESFIFLASFAAGVCLGISAS